MQPTRFQIMRARRHECERWERVRRQHEYEERLEQMQADAAREARAQVQVGALADDQIRLLREQQEGIASVLGQRLDRAALIDKINECEREVVRSWGPTAPRSGFLDRFQEFQPEKKPRPARVWSARNYPQAWGTLKDPVEPEHPPGLITRFFLWWRC